MPTELTPKIAMLSALYFIIAVLILFFLDVGLYYFMNYVVINILNWFNRLNFFWKIFIILCGGVSVFTLLLGLTQRISTLVGGLIFNHLPVNWFTLVSTFIISIGNAIICIVFLWKMPAHFNFWVICELLILSVFIWTLSAITMPAREQMKMYNERNI